MTVKILDISTRKREPYLKHVGVSGKKYQFKWDRALGRYAFEASTQEVVDDIMEGARHWNFGHFSFLLPEEPAPVKKRAPRKRAAKKAVPPRPAEEKQSVVSSPFQPTM